MKISNAHERTHTGLEPRNLFNKNFVDSYPQNLSPIKFKSYTVLTSITKQFNIHSQPTHRALSVRYGGPQLWEELHPHVVGELSVKVAEL